MKPEVLTIEAYTNTVPIDHTLDPAISQQLKRTVFVDRFESNADKGTRIKMRLTPAEQVTAAEVREMRRQLTDNGFTIVGDNAADLGLIRGLGAGSNPDIGKKAAEEMEPASSEV